jgi:hypothetical protein
VILPEGFTKKVFWEVVCLLVLEGDKSISWGEFEGYVDTITESHSDLLAEDGVKFMVCLDISSDSFEPLCVVMMDADKFLPTFEVESPQVFIVTPIVS